MTEKLSDFAAATPSPSDYLCGASVGVNNKFLVSSVVLLPAITNNTFYVSTTGSDSNPGTIAQPFATIQFAVNRAAIYNYLGNFNPTVNVENGTYTLTEPISLPLIVGGEGFLTGNTSTPGNVVLFDSTGNGVISSSSSDAQWVLNGFRYDTPLFVFIINLGTVFPSGAHEWTDRTASGNVLFATVGGFLSMNGATITCLDTLIIGWADVSGTGNINLIFSTFNFRANTSMATFLSVSEHAEYEEFGNTYTNLSTMTGKQLGLSGAPLLITNDGKLTNIGGNSIGTAVDMGILTRAVFNGGDVASNFTNSKAGLPTTTDLPQSQTWAVFKDTSGGGVYVAFNDGGTIKKVQLT